MDVSSYYLTGMLNTAAGAAAEVSRSCGGGDFADAMAELIAQKETGGAASVTAIEREREMLLQRLKDPSGDFFRDLKLAAIRAAREKQEEEEEQEAIDALMQIIDNVTGRAQEDRQRQSDWAGVKLGTLEDSDPRSPSSLQMLAYLAALGDKGTFQIGEDEECEAEKVRESGELHTGSTERKVPSDEEISTLAGKYNFDHISGKDHDAFLEDLVKMGVLSWNEAEHLGYGGVFTGVGTSSTEDPEPMGISYGWLNAEAPSQDVQKRLSEQTLWRIAPRVNGVAVGPEDAALSAYCDILARMRATLDRETMQRTLSGDRIESLAKQYDPHHMEQEEFVGFMDTLEAAGALSPEAAEGIRNAGRWKVTVTEWRLEDGNGRVIDSGTNWTPPGRMDRMEADRWMLPCLYDGGEDDGDVLAWARLGVRGAYAEGFQALVDILQRMETLRAEETAET